MAGGRPPSGKPKKNIVQFRLTDEQKARLDEERGNTPLNLYARRKVLGTASPAHIQTPATKPLATDAFHRHRAKADGQTQTKVGVTLRHFVCEVPGCTAIDRWDR